MASDSREADDRKRASRAEWPITRVNLGDEPNDDLSDITTPAERIAMMWELAESAWKLSGRPLPAYDRRNIPGRLVSLADDDDT